MKRIIGSALIIALGITSCKKDESIIPSVQQNLAIPYNTLTNSSNYLETFKGADGKSSVSFSGQTTRISMFKEFSTYIKSSTSTAINVSKMKDMFENKNSPFADADLNAATTKVIASKTASSFSATEADVERQRFYGYFNELERVSKLNGQTATQGTAGLLGGKRLVDEKGFEYAQFIEKGLIGALMLDQISNIYLGTDKQSADNTTTVEGKNYTALEHHWDEAYGYLTSNTIYPVKGSESYLGEYVRQVGTDVGGNPQTIFLTFLKGRAAIVNNDLTTRDQQIAELRTSLEKAVATVAISYLNKTKTATDDASKFHALSEGYGFIYSLRFAHNAKINKTKSNNLLNILDGKTNGFWSLTNADIDNVRDQIATTFGIDKNAVVNH